MVTGGYFSHPVGQIITLLSILVCEIPTSTATRLVSFPLGTFILQLLPMKIQALSVFLVQIYSRLLGASARSFCIYDVSTSYCNWFFNPSYCITPVAASK